MTATFLADGYCVLPLEFVTVFTDPPADYQPVLTNRFNGEIFEFIVLPTLITEYKVIIADTLNTCVALPFDVAGVGLVTAYYTSIN